MGVFLEHHKFVYPLPSFPCRLLFLARCKRQRRETRYGSVEEVGGGGTNEELAFSGNFPVAPCANIYREYRDLCESLHVCVCAIAMQHSHAHANVHALRAKAIVCIGEPCEYMHKNFCFRVSAPSSRHILPPLGPLSRTFPQCRVYISDRRLRRRRRAV